MSCSEELSHLGGYSAVTVIASQDDIDDPTVLTPNATGPQTQIVVQGAKGTLNFTNLKSFYRMHVYCNSELEEINFPDLVTFSSLEVQKAPVLHNIRLNRWNGTAYDNSGQSSSINIHEAPQLGRVRDQPQIFDIPSLGIVYLDGAGSIQFPRLTNASSITSYDSYTQFPRLATVSNELAVANNTAVFPSLASVGSLTLVNRVVSSQGSPNSGPGMLPDLVVHQSIIIGPQKIGMGSILALDHLKRVGKDLNITGNSNIAKMSFSGVTEVKALNIMDNPNSTIPGDFSHLTTVDSIYLSGIIKQYVARDHISEFNWLIRNRDTANPALFPRLSSAGVVNIEAWNPEFDCSWLVRMRDLGKIAILSCNGTNGPQKAPKDDDTSNSTTSSSPLNGGLSTGASAGIGTGVGVTVLGILAALVWLVVRYRRRLRDLGTTAQDDDDDDAGGRDKEAVEAAPEALQEAGGRPLPFQFGGGEIVEAGGTQLRAEAGDAVASPKEHTRSPVELV
ncbi:hypothetical protein PG985_010002 [Apiospora marii]|uniref:uncharacterized protein n=1 Tax=Apiospora marii TaxID=335849 RepID=UPI00312E0A14